ncbi:PTS system, fructose-specific IIABC component [Spiroplasma gladiatoris]|uniref:PTS system, fructose-specific IIABC component n=1 Tax=Spiroplasma gladiatoris TaxID=2143 RepID=A0A4P7AHI6_9MOLU|nr:fructose-specific PTS transporter subunit EIIC [Spiroplasma gladiatoris]QBQ07657.1 PTS system, fructose-specific IIABC component [Spiroplasma gladiatoris]
MELKDLFHKQISFFNADLKSKDEVIEFLSKALLKEKFVKDEKVFKDAVYKRESEGSTGMGDGIAIPHVLNPTVEKSAIAFCKLKNKVDWQSLDDQPADLIFMIMTNGKDGNEHLEALANLSGYLIKKEVQDGLRSAKSVDEVKKLLSAPKAKKEELKKGESYDVIGITACPTGIAHTYLAAEKIQEYAEELGLKAKVETQGRRGVENVLTAEDVKNAKYIILAHEKAINGMSRFNGYKVVDTSTKEAIYKGKEIIQNYESHPKLMKVENAHDESSGEVGQLDLKQFKKVKQNLLAGVSRMLPFVVAGGIILGFGFLLDYIYTTAMGMKAFSSWEQYRDFFNLSDEIAKSKFKLLSDGKIIDPADAEKFLTNHFSQLGPDGVTMCYASGSFGTVWEVSSYFSAIGKIGMELMIPILGGYVCYSIVGPQGLMVGATAGLMANSDGFAYSKISEIAPWTGAWSRFLPSSLEGMSSGFIGALVGAYLGALVVFGLTKLMKNFGKGLQGVRDIVFIPVLSLLGVAVIMLAVNIPLGYVMYGLQKFISLLADNNLMVIVCILAAFMMCVDMGGPINKIAYTIGTLSVGFNLVSKETNAIAYEQQTMIMTAAMVGGMVPPIGIAISTVLFPKQWTLKSKDAAKTNWLMGMCFVSEGAIPFMIEDPKRISVSAMIGGIVAGLIVGVFKITIAAPHGGIFVAPLTNSLLFDGDGLQKGMGVVLYIVAFMSGSLVMGVVLGFWRLADIKNGKLTLSSTNGVKESLQDRLAKANQSNNTKKVEQFNKKLNDYATFEQNLKAKQLAYASKVAEKNKAKKQKA